MSYSKKQQKAVEKYCKVCHDAGKPESVYRSHFVRASPEPNAKVVCPTLLALECGFCGNCGHTPQYCKVLKDKQKMEKRQQAVAKADEKAAKPEQKKAKVQTNVFAAFADDSDDEEPKVSTTEIATKSATIIKKDEFPALQQASASAQSMNKSATRQSVVPSCVAALQACHPSLSVAKKMPEVTLAKPSLGRVVSAKLAKEQPEHRVIEPQEELSDDDSETENTITAIYDQAVAVRRQPLKASQMNWAAMDSDDSDDEDW
jgi:hypothetical protein